MPRDPEDRLRRMEWPAPDATLRDRILADATMAPLLPWSDRVWFSRTFRWSVAAAMVALIVLAQWPASDLPVGLQPSGSAQAEAWAVEEVVNDAGLPSIAAASLIRRSSAGGAFRPGRTTAWSQLMDTGGGQ